MALSAPVVFAFSLVAAQGGAEAPAASPGAAEEVPRILVLDLEAADVPASEVAIVNGIVAQTLSEKSSFRVVTSDDLRQLLALETEREAVGCDTSSASCLAEIAGAMGTRYVVFGRVGALGKLRIVQLNLYDSDKASAIGRQDRRTERIEELPGLVEDATAALVGPLMKHANFAVGPGGQAPAAGAQGSGATSTDTPPAPAPEASAAADAESAGGSNVLPWVLMPAGGVAGLAGLGLAVGGGAASVVLYLLIRDDQYEKEVREGFRTGAFLAAGTAVVGAVVIGLGLATLGGGVLLWE